MQSGVKIDTSVCKVLLKALHIAGQLDDADRVYADVSMLTHTSHWSSVHTTVQTIDFHTYSVHMCYTALRSVFHQVHSASLNSTLCLLNKWNSVALFSVHCLLLLRLCIYAIVALQCIVLLAAEMRLCIIWNL
jgi:hypothetical protein